VSVSRDEVLHLARLAALAVDPSELDALTEQMDRIVGFVGQLGALDVPDSAEPGESGGVILRADVVDAPEGPIDPAALSPFFEAGFFTVPRLGTLDRE